jgi:hypothetical protein
MSEPLSTPADVVAFESGRQKVRDVNGVPLCDWHTARAYEHMGLSDQIGHQTGLMDETEPHTHSESPSYAGQCEACRQAQPRGQSRPWEDQVKPNQPRRMVPEKSDRKPGPRSWPQGPKRTGPFTPQLPPSMSYRVAVRRGQKPLDPESDGLHRVAHQISSDMPDIVVIKKMAHDSGDGQTVMHCCFCGSGQIIATSDGGIECEFCHASFTVQIQPQYPAFPQTIDGQPVNVPGMGPDFSQYGGTPPGQEAPLPMDGEEEDDTDEGDPMGTNADETQPPEEEDDEDSANGNFPITKKTYRTTTGAVLDHESYLKHLALSHTNDTRKTLWRVRQTNGVR